MARLQGRVTQSSTGRRARRRMETREKIFRTAMQLFAERGFFQTTTEDITEAADVGQGTFFNYFPSKQHVFTVLSEKQIEKVLAARHEAEAEKSSIHDVLHRLMHRIAEEPGRTQALTRSLIAAFISNDQVREMLRATLARGRESLTAIMALGQRRGEIRRDRKAADLALGFHRNVLGTLLLWAIHPGADLHEWLEKTFCDFWSALEIREKIGSAGKENRTFRDTEQRDKEQPRAKSQS
jgi:AcrR family transcriptional regulator